MTKRNAYLAVGIPTIVVLLLLAGLVSQRSMMNGFTGSTGLSEDSSYSMIPGMGQKGLNYGTIGSVEMMDSDGFFPPEAPTAGETAADVDQKLIKTGYLALEVNDVAENVGKIGAYATGNGGFVESSDIREREDGSHFGNMTVRIPSNNFEIAMDTFASYATLVQTRSSQGQDVTERYTDLEARLSNAQAQEQEYLKILQQATSVQDILAVQQYLGQIRQEIESYQGQINYLSNQTSYSTISVALSEASVVRLPTKAFRPIDTLKDAIQGLGAIAQRLVEGIIYLVIIGGGIILPIGLIVWAIVALVRRRK